MKNYYEILEVNQKASKEVIEKAYKVLIKKYHPDLYVGEKKKYAETKTKEINEAYHVLSDQFLREQYDNEIYNQNRGREQGEVRTRPEIRNTTTQTRKKYQTELKEEQTNKNKVGTFSSTIELTKQLIHDLARSKEKRQEFKEMTKKDALAIVLTIIVIILIGIILWFVPFTNGWMRELLFENPIFNWIGSFFK